MGIHLMNRQLRCAFVALLIAAIALTTGACGTGEPVPPNDPGQPGASQGQQAEPGGTGVTAPGRLLFVREGTLWLWQDGQASPLAGDGAILHPAWSPDGRQIAYVERGASFSDLVLANASGEPQERLTDHESEFPPESRERICDSIWALYPAWAPSGRRLAFVTQEASPLCPAGAPAIEFSLSLATIERSDGEQNDLYANEQAHVEAPAFRPPRGTEIAYTHIDLTANGQQRLYRLDVATGDVEPYPGAPPRSYDPAFSRDGRWLTFAARDGDETDIWLLPGDAESGSNPAPQRLTTLGMARAPAFSPNGRLLAFLAIPPGEDGFELWIAELSLRSDGTVQADEIQQLTTGLGIDAASGISWAS
jgi:TolB protein